ncbi:hypothetical protein C2G38_2139097 [Gigaspora rosea]|uniref:BED-type domain-containing protein n=1 Tax=Gigaspora rosea TaxID=44941 RepID=A0A397VUW8_9GLOM|nr:hypothetical protein C2G38_2139097 [Gigaspora rosea]
MSFRERSTSPTPSLEEAPCTPQGSSVSTSASTNEINNEPNDKTDNGANNKHFQTISRKKRQATKKKKPSTSATPALTSQRSNASYTHHFFECDKTDNQIQYCKICVKECEGTHKQPYPYTKSNGSTGHLTYHLRDKHNITASNYKEHLDSSQEVTFFRLPKQAQRLRETQIKAVSTSSQGINSDNESINPLEVLTDSKTRWNLAYLAWKRISELHPIMRSLAASLQLKPDTMSKKDGEKLDQLCLTSVEKKYFSISGILFMLILVVIFLFIHYYLFILRFVDEMINLLKPFKEITRHFSGSKYPTINLIYPYVRMLKNKYAPVDERGEYVEDWLALIYGPSLESSDDNTYISSSDEDSIPSGGNRKQWQYAHRSRYSQGQGRKRRKRREHKTKELDDTNTIRYLPPTNCEGLLEKLRAAIYLSLDELWGIPDEVGLKASMLDPRVLKLLPFATNDERKNTETQLRAELAELEAQFNQNNDNDEISTMIIVIDYLFTDESKKSLDEYEKDELEEVQKDLHTLTNLDWVLEII